MDTWQTEEEIAPQQRSPEYQVKARLVLEDSGEHTWGLVKFIGTRIFHEFGQGEVVGTWSKSPADGYYHISLETPIMVLVDKATQLHIELVNKRREDITKAIRATPKYTPPTRAFDDLRKSIKGT